MLYRSFLSFFLAIFSLSIMSQAAAQHQHPIYWEVHDTARSAPPVIDPGPAPSEPQPAPSDAIVLFDGTDLSAWESADGGDAEWEVQENYMEVVPGTGTIQTRDGFGDVQLHVEWAVPEEVEGEGQDRANSGVFFMGQYEVQVLDSYKNATYPDGQAASAYGQYPPLVNAMRPPGEWQTYDIVFRRPHFDSQDNLVKPARLTVFHNGVLVLENVELTGPTAHQDRPPYEAHPERLPIQLQDHNEPVRFRNIWLRELR